MANNNERVTVLAFAYEVTTKDRYDGHQVRNVVDEGGQVTLTLAGVEDPVTMPRDQLVDVDRRRGDLRGPEDA